MPWCPKCRNEYRIGTETCAECGCNLVDSLPEPEGIPVYFGEKEQMEKLAAFLSSNGRDDFKNIWNDTDQVFELYIAKEEEKLFKDLIAVFLKEEAGVKKKEEFPAKAKLYQDSALKAEDNRSSAYTLLFVGTVGMIAVLLCITGIIPLKVEGFSKYLVYGVMGALFILFIVMGVVSMKSSRIFAQKAAQENGLTQEIRKWCMENLTAQAIDQRCLGGDAQAEETKYFKRAEYLRQVINDTFLNLDEAYLEHFIDEIYPELFDEKQ